MKIKKSFFQLFFILLIITSCTSIKKQEVITKAGYVYLNDTNMWNHIFKLAKPYVIPQLLPSSVILPHHDITEQRLNSFYSALSSLEEKPSVIVLLCTDHFEQGKKNIVAPKNTYWQTPDGDLFVDEELLSNVVNAPQMQDKISLQNEIWNIEHGIYIHTPFINHYLPGIKIVPFLLKGFSSDEEFEDYKLLGKVLAQLVPQDALLIASIDLSHYQIPAWTNIHDIVTENTIQNMESPRHLEIDSPESMTCLFEYNLNRGYTNPVLIDKSSTYDYIPQEKVVCTSHQYWTFYKPENISQEQIDDFKNKALKKGQRVNQSDYKNTVNQTILLLGSGNMNEGVRDYWYWDRYKKSNDPTEILLHDMAGSEARFLTGFDAIVFDPPVGSVYTKKLHGTTLKIHSTNNELQNIPFEEKQPAQINGLVINVQSGEEYPEVSKIKELLNFFDFVLLRATDSSKDAMAYVCNSRMTTEYTCYNLGILYSAEKQPIKGAVLSLSWQNSKLSTCLMPYESPTGIPPQIEQYSGEL